MDGYTFSSKPRAVTNKKKFRNLGASMVRDPRVVRGNTYSKPGRSQIATPLPTKQPNTKFIKPAIPSIFDVKPEVSKHLPVDISSFLVEEKKPVVVVDVNTQTNEFHDRPPTPEYVPKKTGVDASTQIEPGQLFDFDAEIGPLLEVVASKTLEQSLLEVEEEAELKRIRRRQLELTQIQQRRRQKIHELELEKRHEWEEKEQCVMREQDRVAKETVVYRKVGSLNLMKTIIGSLRGQVYDAMVDNGFFRDPTEVEVKQLFMPWLIELASKKVEKIGFARKVADTVIAAAADLADQEHEQRKCFLRVKARSEVVVKLRINNVGPVVIEPKDTIRIIRRRLQDWIRQRGVSEEQVSHLKLAYKGKELSDDTELLNIPMFDASQVEVISDFVVPPSSP